MNRIAECIRAISPSCKPEYLAAFDGGDAAFDKYGLTTPQRQAQFIGQFGGETGGGAILYESGDYKTVDRLMQIFGAGHHSAAIQPDEAAKIIALPMPQKERVLFERVYGAGNPHMMTVLGNRPGDGWPFRGTGPLQSTGRAAAKAWGDKLGVDFTADPTRMVLPQYLLAPALFEWDSKKLNRLADLGDIRSIRHAINGGYNGLEDCESWEAKAWAFLRDPSQPADSWSAYQPNPTTTSLQNSLNLLGYRPALKVDGKQGPATKAAILWFQKENGLPADGICGPLTARAVNQCFAARR